MLSFKDLEEVLQPKAAGEKRFKDKHVVDTIDYPLNDAEINKGTKKSPAKKKRIADSEEGKDAAVYEENITKCKCETCGCEVCECKMNEENEKMTPAQEKKREEIVMAMKKDKEKLQSRYGESWKAVMYATATKQAMSESVDLDEALPPHLAKYIGKDGDFTPEVKKRLGKDFMKRMQVPSKKKSNVKDVTPKGYGPNEELDESAAGIAQLKKAYEPLRGKKISLDNAKKLSAIMDKFADDKAMLQKLAKADIPFVSSKAVTILITKHNMKGAEINKMRKEEAGLDEKAPKMKMTDIMNRKKKPKTYQVDIDGSRATVTAASEKMAIQKAMTQLKINKKIKPLPKATVKVIKEAFNIEVGAKVKMGKNYGEVIGIEKVMGKPGLEIKWNDGTKGRFPMSSLAGLSMDRKANYKIDEEKVMEEVGLDEANPAKMSDDVLKSKLSQMEKSLKTRGDSPAIQFEIKRLKKEMKKRGIQEEVDLDEAFKINATNQKLNDGSMVKISKDDASALNGLYNSLNPANAKTMIKKVMQDKKSYGEILAFAKQAM